MKETHIICILHPKDLIPQLWEVIKGWLRRNGKHKYKSLSILHVEITHSCELFLHKQPTFNLPLQMWIINKFMLVRVFSVHENKITATLVYAYNHTQKHRVQLSTLVLNQIHLSDKPVVQLKQWHLYAKQVLFCFGLQMPTLWQWWGCFNRTVSHFKSLSLETRLWRIWNLPHHSHSATVHSVGWAVNI